MFRFLKNLFGGDATEPLGQPPPWSFSDAEQIGEAYSHPDRVDYELDLLELAIEKGTGLAAEKGTGR